MSEPFSAGLRVRLFSDPGNIGVLTGKSKIRGGKIIRYVQFPDKGAWTSEHAIELVPEGKDDVYTLLANKQFGRVTDLRRNLTYIQLSGRFSQLSLLNGYN